MAVRPCGPHVERNAANGPHRKVEDSGGQGGRRWLFPTPEGESWRKVSFANKPDP